MRDDPFVADLVTRARKDDQQAWDSSSSGTPRSYGPSAALRANRADAEDVGQRTGCSS